MMTKVIHFGGGRRSGGKSAMADDAMRLVLRQGGKVLFASSTRPAIVTLADDGFTLVHTPMEPALPAPIWIDELEQD